MQFIDVKMSMKFTKPDKYRIRTFCRLMLPLILLLQLSLPGVALCLEQDGNVELETYANGACYEKNSGATAVIHSFEGTGSEHCGSCIDIPTTDKNSEYKAVSLNDLTPEIDLHSFAVYKLSSLVLLEAPDRNFISEESNSFDSLLETLRMTVITC